jgi:hypothetical protein
MSQFYDLASLVVIPSGYKASTIYAQKPLTTDGQVSFSRASTATRVNSSGLIEAVASNVPRLDYLGSSCPRLLLEPQRTNLLLFSEQIDNAAWGTGAVSSTVTVTANQSTAPDGTMSADKVVLGAVTSVGNYAVVAQAFTATAAAYSSSFYFKGENGGETIYISFTKDGVNYTRQLCTLTTAWQRFTLTSTLTAGADNIQFGVDRRDGSQGATSAQTFYVWGAQLEAGAYATSYVKTEAAAVTRLKDNCVKTGVSSLIGQTEGTVFVEFKMNGQSLNEDIYSNNKNLTGSISIQLGTNGQLQGYICFNGSFISLQSSTGAIQIGQTYKIALAYKTGNSALYINGTQVDTNTTAFAFTTTLSEIDIANVAVFFAHLNNKEVSQVLQFKTRLTNAQLAELTAL